MVSPSSCALETMPRPLRNATTGASISSASSRISSPASIAPLPTKIMGVLLLAISAAAFLTRSGSGRGAGKGSNVFGAPVSARWVKTSHGISSATGPRRPDSISWKARDTSAGAASGYSMRSVHLTKVRNVASWSGISCRCPRPLPRNAVGTCPVRHNTGSFAPNAVSRAAPAFSTPGPGTTLKTPGLPVERA